MVSVVRRVIVLLVTTLTLRTHHARVIDDSSITAFFNGDCDHNSMCVERCRPWDHGYICECFGHRVLSNDGYSCEDVVTKAEVNYTSLQHSTNATSKPSESTHVDTKENTLKPFNHDKNDTVLRRKGANNVTIESMDLRKNLGHPSMLAHSLTTGTNATGDVVESGTKTLNKNSDRGVPVDNLTELIDSNSIKPFLITCDNVYCQNAGWCEMTENNSAFCNCPLGYAGAKCETEIELLYPLFRGKGYLVFPKLKKAYKDFDVNLKIRPDSKDGLILFTAQDPYANKDFFSLSLINGHIEFRFDCGTGKAIIVSENVVNIGEWNKVRVGRREANGSLKLNKGITQYGHSQGNYSRITIKEHLYLGGHPNITAISPRVGSDRPFSGCIEQLKISEKVYHMKKSVAGEGDAVDGLNVDECSADVCKNVVCQNGGACRPQSPDRHVCVCTYGTYGNFCETSREIRVPSFTSHSYLQIKRREISALQETIEIVLKPSKPNGLLLYNGASQYQDFISLALIEGHIEFRFDLGSGDVLLRSAEPVTLDEWHEVKIERTERQAYMTVDSAPTVGGTNPGAFLVLNVGQNLYLGGHRKMYSVQPRVNTSESFTGCIQRVVIDGEILSLNTEPRDGTNVGNCDHDCFNDVCQNEGICIPQKANYVCSCPLGYTQSNCEKYMNLKTSPLKFSPMSYLEYKSDEIIRRVKSELMEIEMEIKVTKPVGMLLWIGSMFSDFLYLGFNNGQLEMRYDLGEGEAFIRTEWHPSADASGWSVVRASRSRQKGVLQLNNGTKTTNSSPGSHINLDSDTPLYIGGTPSSITRRNTNDISSFNGCMRKLTLDTNYNVNLFTMASTGRNVDLCV